MQADTQPLEGILVVELAWYLPIAFAGSELVRLGARVVRIEPPDGDPLRHDRAGVGPSAPRRQGVGRLRPEDGPGVRACALRRAPTSCSKGFRPGVAARLGDRRRRSARIARATARSPASAPTGRHAQRAGHDLNYLGWAGVLEDTPTWPPVQIADLAAGGLGAVTEVLAALVRARPHGRGAPA